MNPVFFLAIVVAITAVAFISQMISRRRVRHRLQKLAVELRMAYSPYDRFGLADRVADRFPIPGAAMLRVTDLLYASTDEGYRYVFSAEYTIGVIRSKSRVRRVAAFAEPKNRSDSSGWTPIVLAPGDRPVIAQYESLARRDVRAREEEPGPEGPA